MLTLPNERITVVVDGHQFTVRDLEFEYEYQRLGGGGPLQAVFTYDGCDFRIPINDYTIIKEHRTLTTVELKVGDTWKKRLLAFTDRSTS